MKTPPILAVFAAVLLVSISHASAIGLGNFVGTWRGVRIEAGDSTPNKLVAKKKGGNLIVTETGDHWLGGRYSFTHHFSANGKYESVYSSYGYVLATNTGKWHSTQSAISISGLQQSDFGLVSFKGTFRLISKNQMSFTGKSGDVKMKITAKKS